ncbi:MAG: AAA family ATPase [Candidatus Margulisiibacteriota bacterium]
MLLGGGCGTGKTEFVYNLASRVNDPGSRANLFYLTEAFFGGTPLEKVEVLFREAEEYACATGMRSIVLWENPEVYMGFKYRSTLVKTYSASSGSTSTQTTQTLYEQGDTEATKMTSLVEKMLDGSAEPLANTFVFFTTNNSAAIDPALCRPGRLRYFKFPGIFEFTQRRTVRYGTLIKMLPVVEAQFLRLGDEGEDIASIDVVKDTIAEVRDLIRQKVIENKYSGDPYHDFRHKLEEAGIYVPYNNVWKPSMATPAFISSTMSRLVCNIPPEIRSVWGLGQTKALVSYLFYAASGSANYGSYAGRILGPLGL